MSGQSGADLIAKERARQQTDEGYTPEHDAEHDNGELVEAAICYAAAYRWPTRLPSNPGRWPWEPEAWKLSTDDPVKNLTKAGALITAEIDRLLAARAEQ